MAVARKVCQWYTGKVDQAEVQRLFIRWKVVRRGTQQREEASPAILVDLILGGKSFSYQYLVSCHNWAGKNGSSGGEILFGTRSLFYCIIHLLSAYVNSRSKVWLARIERTIARRSLSIGREILWGHLRLPWLWRQRQLQETPQADKLCLT